MGDFFLASFFRAVLKKETIKDCFDHASEMIKKWTSTQNPVFIGEDFGIGVSSRHKFSYITDIPNFVEINKPNVNSMDLMASVDEVTVDNMWIDIKRLGPSKKMARFKCEETLYNGKRLFKAKEAFGHSGIYDIFFVVEDKIFEKDFNFLQDDFSFISSVKHMTLIKFPETPNKPSPKQKKHADICNNGMIDLNDLQSIFLLQSIENQDDISVSEIKRICEQSNE